MKFYQFSSVIVVISLFFLFPGFNSAQNQAFFDNISTESGLSSQKVIQIIQDDLGFMWFASQNGLNKYDGYSISVYKNDPTDSRSLSNNNLRSISEQGDFLWIGTFGGGLNKFNRINNFKKYLHIPGDTLSLVDNFIYHTFFDIDSTLWVGTQKGLSRFMPESESFKNYFLNKPIYRISEDQNANLFLSTDDGFYIFNKKSKKHKKIIVEHTNTTASPIHVLVDRDKFIWIGSNHGLKTFDLKSGEIKSLDQNFIKDSDITSVPIQYLFEDSDKGIWIGTFRSGLYKFDKSTEELTRYVRNEYDVNSISHNSIINIYEDKSHNMWLATPGGGLNKLNRKRQKFNHYYHIPFSKNSLSNNSVLSFYEDERKSLWVGTDYDITVYDRLNNTSKRLDFPNNNNKFDGLISILAINKGLKNEMWIGTRLLGLQVYDQKKNKFIDIKKNPLYPKKLYNAWIRRIMHDSKGNIWITSDKGLFCYENETKKFVQYNTSNSNISDEVTISIYEDDSGNIWVGTRSGGVNKLDQTTGTFTNYNYHNNDSTSLTSDYVISLNGDDKYIWAGTLNGLSRINRKTYVIKQIKEKDGLPDDCINGILVDKSGGLWMSTNYGITHYQPNKNVFRNYDKFDRLQDNKFKGLSCYKSDSGVMYFGGTNGFNSFIPEKVKDNVSNPSIVLTSFKVLYKEKELNKEISLINSIELDYFENALQFEFASLDYTAPQKNLYQYKLEGFDSHWSSPSNQRSANYTNLDPGEYTFRVIGSNNDYYWNNEGIKAKIIIKTPYWNTWWFRSLIGLGIVLIITLMYRMRVGGIKKQRKILEELNLKLSAEIAEKKETEIKLLSARDKAEQADKLKSEFLAQISHEIRSPINIISNYVSLIKEELSDKKNEVLDLSFIAIDKANNRIIRSIDLIINMSEIQLGIYEPTLDRLNLKNDILDDIVLQYKYSAKRKNIDISFSSKLDTPLILGDRYSVTQIFANLIDNAIKYTNSGEINVSLLNHNNKIKVMIADTGAGISEEYLPTLFDSFTQEDRGYTRKFEGNGLGLALVKKYCELNNASISVNSKKGDGTTFSVEFDNLNPQC